MKKIYLILNLILIFFLLSNCKPKTAKRVEEFYKENKKEIKDLGKEVGKEVGERVVKTIIKQRKEKNKVHIQNTTNMLVTIYLSEDYANWESRNIPSNYELILNGKTSVWAGIITYNTYGQKIGESVELVDKGECYEIYFNEYSQKFCFRENY